MSPSCSSSTPAKYLQKLKSSQRVLSLLQHPASLAHSHLLQIHSHLITTSTLSDPFAASKLLSALTSSNLLLPHAYSLFLRLPRRTPFLYNSLLSSFSQSQSTHPSSSLSLYRHMLRHSLLPNNYTFSFLLRAAAALSSLPSGSALHAHSILLGWAHYDFVANGLVHFYAKCGLVDDARKVFDESPVRDVFAWTAMVNGYVKCGLVGDARALFDEMPVRNVVSWSAMIAGFAQKGLFKEALEMFGEMQAAGVRPNDAAIVGALTACAFLGALDQGRWIHGYVGRSGVELDGKLGTALVEMYMKCGCVEMATAVFEEMRDKDVFAFTSLVSGLSNNGLSLRSIEVFKRMREEGVEPNRVTFLCVLSACSREGMVEEGLRIFKSMRDQYGIEPGSEHYGCAVDLLGRAGLLREAEEMAREMPGEPDSYVLGALLNACRIHGDVGLGEEMVRRLTKQELDHGGVHTLLSNIYASALQWDEVEKVRKEMGDRRVRKMPGCSMIVVEGAVCEFGAGQRSHDLTEDMISCLMGIERHSTSFLVDDYGKTAVEFASSEGDET